MPGHIHIKWYQFEATLNCWQKINFLLHVFLQIFQRYCKVVVLGTFGMPGYAHPKWYYQLIETSRVNLQAKINFIPNAFRETLLRYANFLFWYFGHTRLHKPNFWQYASLQWNMSFFSHCESNIVCWLTGIKFPFLVHPFFPYC